MDGLWERGREVDVALFFRVWYCCCVSDKGIE